MFSDRVDAMEMLIAAGTDINTLNHKHHSPLQIAVAKPSKRCVAALLKRDSCNVNLQVIMQCHRISDMISLDSIPSYYQVSYMISFQISNMTVGASSSV